jgi:hypothetical protein
LRKRENNARILLNLMSGGMDFENGRLRLAVIAIEE